MRTIDDIKLGDNIRLAFVMGRDGLDGAMQFARQTYKIYRAQRKVRPLTYGKEYRQELIVSCVVFREFIRRNK